MSDSGTQSNWYTEERVLVEELRRAMDRGARLPRIQGYQHLEEIARGGQGVVYSAQQERTRRRVAVKVVASGPGGVRADMRRRFEREIEVVASLRHPHIVSVYDSGVTDDDEQLLYFVMEYIDGQALSEVLPRDVAGARAKRRELMGLMAEVCDAVHHAHQRGVIHRDLKPSNIRIDREGQPHVLDFGLAKVHEGIESAERLKVTMTGSGEFMGSLPWASPEQARGKLEEVDVRSDVYAVGVMLHQAVTGGYPYDVGAGLREVLEMIVTREPARASSVDGSVDGDLETIVLKCLAKEPGQRYQTMGEVAADLRHWLAGEAIMARRESAWHAMRKKMRRHRAAGIAGLLVVMALAGGLAATLWQAREADKQREKAERRLADVRSLARTFMFDFADELAGVAGARRAREKLVTTALHYLEELSEDASEPEILAELASAYQRVGDMQGSPFFPNLGNTAGALEAYERALGLQREYVRIRPGEEEGQRRLAQLMLSRGDVQMWSGGLEGAGASYSEARALLEPLAAQTDKSSMREELLAVFVKTADLEVRQGRMEAAEACLRSALPVSQRLAEERPGEMKAMSNLSTVTGKLGNVLADSGREREAEEYHRRSMEQAREIFAAHRENQTAKRNVSLGLNQLAGTLASLGKKEEAMRMFEESLAIAEEILSTDEQNVLAASDVTFTVNRIGSMHYEAGAYERALEMYERGEAIRARISANDPMNASFKRDLVISKYFLAETHIAMGKDGARGEEERRAELETAKAQLEEVLGILAGMKASGTLMPADEGLPATMQAVLEECAKARGELEAGVGGGAG